MRMEQRRISVEDVVSALSHPVQVDQPGRRGRRERLGFDTLGRLLKVVLDESNAVVNVMIET